jgi:hypothetical protein
MSYGRNRLHIRRETTVWASDEDGRDVRRYRIWAVDAFRVVFFFTNSSPKIGSRESTRRYKKNLILSKTYQVLSVLLLGGIFSVCLQKYKVFLILLWRGAARNKEFLILSSDIW